MNTTAFYFWVLSVLCYANDNEFNAFTCNFSSLQMWYLSYDLHEGLWSNICDIFVSTCVKNSNIIKIIFTIKKGNYKF